MTDVKKERWATVGTGASIVAVMATTWLLCQSVLAWTETFRLEDLAYARDEIDEFEVYRPERLLESGTAWAALAVAVVAIVVAGVAGVRADRWRPAATAASTVIVMVAVAAGAVLPIGPFVLLVGAIPVTLALRSLNGPAPRNAGVDSARVPTVP